jgi:hypothetical protein
MATTVLFGAAPATDVVVVSPTEVTCTVPDGTGTVGVTVQTAHGSDTLAAAFTYDEDEEEEDPQVADVDPGTGAAGSGVTITGQRLG